MNEKFVECKLAEFPGCSSIFTFVSLGQLKAVVPGVGANRGTVLFYAVGLAEMGSSFGVLPVAVLGPHDVGLPPVLNILDVGPPAHQLLDQS